MKIRTPTLEHALEIPFVDQHGQSRCYVDGLDLADVRVPKSVTELGELVKLATAESQAIYPLGGRTMLGYGLPPSRPGIGVDLRGLTQIIDYPARDMTITVQAGITLSRLQETLAAENQRLPVDVPHAERATLGGAIATNMSGPHRYGFGTLRDYVIGISVVNDEGREVKAGGRVVKNVAGYDMCKLYVGSLGTLGIITQVTLKLKPRPEKQALAALRCPGDRLEALLEALHMSPTRPTSVSLLHPAAAGLYETIGPSKGGTHDWFALVGFEETTASVDWQIGRLHEDVRLGVFVVREVVDADAERIWHALADFPLEGAGDLTFKASLLPSAMAAFCRLAANLPGIDSLQAEAGNGIVVGHGRAGLMLEEAQAMLNPLQDAAAAARGNIVLLRCPSAWKTTLPVWGRPRGDAWLMRVVKNKLDPQGRFNPGRFVQDI